MPRRSVSSTTTTTTTRMLDAVVLSGELGPLVVAHLGLRNFCRLATCSRDCHRLGETAGCIEALVPDFPMLGLSSVVGRVLSAPRPFEVLARLQVPPPPGRAPGRVRRQHPPPECVVELLLDEGPTRIVQTGTLRLDDDDGTFVLEITGEENLAGVALKSPVVPSRDEEFKIKFLRNIHASDDDRWRRTVNGLHGVEGKKFEENLQALAKNAGHATVSLVRPDGENNRFRSNTASFVSWRGRC